MTDSSPHKKLEILRVNVFTSGDTKTVSFATRVCNYIYWYSGFDASVSRARPSNGFKALLGERIIPSQLMYHGSEK
jgi:hypothetical protein